jgi:hypothetical protein
MQSKQLLDSNLIPELVTHNQLAEGIMADPCRDFWILENGTGKKWPNSMRDI